jgi:hypothetical protein
MKIKFTLIDYIIIILVICAIVFAFIHLTDDSFDYQKVAFDESTVNKIPDTYLKYYKDGYVIKATVEGFNSTNGEEVTLNGTVLWEDDTGGNGVNLLLESDNQTYLVGSYRNVPHADIYIDHITLEIDGEKYDNLCEIKVQPEEINSLKDITSRIPNNTDYEITTEISIDNLSAKDMQKITNKLASSDKRSSIKQAIDVDNQLIIKSATRDNLEDADSILGNINGVTNEITIRIYNCNDSQIDEISKNFNVINIRNF